jgi:hypothetical protein
MCAFAVVVTACGGTQTSQGTATPSTSPSPSAGGLAPPDLVGTYATTLKTSDYPPSPHPELVDSSSDWTITISNSGAPGGGPALTIRNGKKGPLDTISFSAQGKELLLHRVACPSNENASYEEMYSYQLTGSMLTFSTIRDQCSDHVLQTILTSEPWNKTGS